MDNITKIVDRTVIGDGIAYMYSNGNRLGTCPVCHNTMKIPDLFYGILRNKK